MNIKTKTEMNPTYPPSVIYRPILFPLLILSLSWLMYGCCKGDDSLSPSGLSDNVIVIGDIAGVPAGVVFDKVVVKIQGDCWDVISTVEAPFINGRADLELPATFAPAMLQKSIRADKKDLCAHWPTAVSSTDPAALVAKLGDILIYHGDKKVGRVRVTDWAGTGETAGKGFIYYFYADRPFALSGGNRSFLYNKAAFKRGWNACANVNSSTPDETPDGSNPATCTTVIRDDAPWRWLFEAH